jgi:GT2 family glycosyltransferase
LANQRYTYTVPDLHQDPLVIIVAYHNTDDLERCLTALKGWGDVIVVDNGDEPAVMRLVHRMGVRYVSPGENVGFAAGVNVGLQRRRPGQDVLLLNPDAELGPDGAMQVVRALQDSPLIAAVAPRLRDSNGGAQRTEWPVPSPREAWIDAIGLRRWIAPRRRFLSGAVLLLRGRALDDVGGLDERYFLYAEESDWQLRAQRAGWTVAVADDVVVEHAGGRSSVDNRTKEVLFHRSGEAFGRKWYGSAGWQVMRLAAITGAFLRLLTHYKQPERRRYAFLFWLYLRGADRI